mmetsp:Transcript_52411/g.133196  ORF Transcript_52411/g.133196 Transcript_52411/m.133196 type:complete len:346 (-) Transcript_52411:1304-2341(-)
MPSIEVADTVRGILDVRLHTRRALDRVEVVVCVIGRPIKRGACAQAPCSCTFLVKIPRKTAGTAGAETPVAHLNLGSFRDRNAGVLGFDLPVSPIGDHPGENLCQSARVQLQLCVAELTGRHIVEDPNRTQSEGKVDHTLGRALSHECIVSVLAHWNVASAKVIVTLVTTLIIPDELLLAGAAPDCPVREEHRHASAMLHQLHRLCKHRLRICGAAAMQRNDAVIVQRSLDRVDAGQHALEGDIQLVQLPHAVRVSLGTDDIRMLPIPSICGILEGEVRHNAGLSNDVSPCVGPMVHSRGDRVEGVLCQQSLALRPGDIVNKRLQDASFARGQCSPILVHVYVGN